MSATVAVLEQELGLSLKEARSKLSELKKGLAVLLHKHVIEVEKLVQDAYGNLSDIH